MTTRKLSSLGRAWLHRLGLSDWVVTFRVVRMKEHDGYSNWNADAKTATVEIAHGSKTAEETLIHELIHLSLEGHRITERRYEQGYEDGIDRIATAFRALSSGDQVPERGPGKHGR